MISRLTKVQLIAFLLVTIVGVTYVGFRYAGFEGLFRSPTYPVKMQLTDSGGIFTGADVTYRGVSVGRVGELTLTPQGVDVQLNIENDAPPIPADLDAEIRNLSAIGEQFVDLLPRTDTGPYLDGSSVIPASRTKTPIPVETLIADLDDFARSVPLGSLRTVVNELGTGFTDTANPIQQLLDSTDAFSREAVAALPPTLTLIRDGRTVLTTQNAVASDFASFSRDLRALAAELREHDPDLERLLETAPYAAQQISALLEESGDEIGVLIADLLTVARIAEPRQPALRQILVTYPGITSNGYTVFPNDGTAHLGLVLNVFDPPVCVYEGGDRRPGNQLEQRPVPFGVKSPICPDPPLPGTLIRGEQNAPRGPAPDRSGSGNGVKRPGQPPAQNAVDMDGPASILALP